MTKDSLRKLYREKRKALPEKVYMALNHSLADKFIEGADLSEVSTLHLFLPIYKNREPDTWLIIRHIQAYYPHIRIVVPRIDAATYTMDCMPLGASTTFSENQYGIPEPAGSECVDPDTIDMVLVPLLAYDLKGYRVGYGKGYYDRFFASCRNDVEKYGLSFFDPVEAISDTNGYDIPLDVAITPTSVYRF